MTRMTTAARGAVIAIALVLVAAAPAAAGQTTRTAGPLKGSFVLPAGTACAFDVAGEPDAAPSSAAAFQAGGFRGETDFSDGTVMYSVRARGAYVNLETGARFPTLDTFREVDHYDAATGILEGVLNGKSTSNFLPGDVGPYGVVGSDGALYHFDGTAWFTYDTNTGAFSIVSYIGPVIDVCAALS